MSMQLNRPPFDLAKPDLSTKKLCGNYLIKYQSLFQLEAFFSVSETAENTEDHLGALIEEQFKLAVSKTCLFDNADMKSHLKCSIVGDGKNAWNRAKS